MVTAFAHHMDDVMRNSIDVPVSLRGGYIHFLPSHFWTGRDNFLIRPFIYAEEKLIRAAVKQDLGLKPHIQLLSCRRRAGPEGEWSKEAF